MKTNHYREDSNAYQEMLEPMPLWEKAATIVVYLILAVLIIDLVRRAFPWLF